MLLERVMEKNPAIVEAAVTLHQRGDIPAGSWLFDLDAVAHNACLIADEAKRLGLTTYLMTKQIGRNPFVTALALHMGLDRTVAVDIQCALLLRRYGLPIGHLGHLNQAPMHEVARAVSMEPDVITVYSVEAARRISAAAGAAGRRQDLLLQVYGPADIFFPGQEGGFPLAGALDAAREIQALPNVRIAGVTSFPVLDYDFSGERELAFNPNMATIREFAGRLRDELGCEITQINAPGNTSLATLAMLREGARRTSNRVTGFLAPRRRRSSTAGMRNDRPTSS
jgi:predicted amino acid racemase